MQLSGPASRLVLLLKGAVRVQLSGLVSHFCFGVVVIGRYSNGGDLRLGQSFLFFVSCSD